MRMRMLLGATKKILAKLLNLVSYLRAVKVDDHADEVTKLFIGVKAKSSADVLSLASNSYA